MKPPPDTLRWPASFDDNLRRLIYRALCRELPDAEQHQDILDALAYKASNKHHPFRTSPVAYAVKLCRLASEGKFNPVGPLPAAKGRPKPNGTDVIDRMREVSRLRNEIAALERLAEGSPSAELRQAIEGRLRDLDRIESTCTHRTHERHALEELISRERKEASAWRRPDRVSRAADALQECRDRPR